MAESQALYRLARVAKNELDNAGEFKVTFLNQVKMICFLSLLDDLGIKFELASTYDDLNLVLKRKVNV